jgi:hypothetical protein
MKGALALLLTAPLALVSSQLAHDAAYLGAEPDAEKRSHLLERTGHAYLAELAKPTALVAVALCLTGLALYSVYVRRGGRHPRPGALPFALVPVAAFMLQEHIERVIELGRFPHTLLLERPVLLGLALQLPFALVAYGLAWLLLRATEALVRALSGEWRGSSLRNDGSARLPLAVAPARMPVRARGYTERGPPLPA